MPRTVEIPGVALLSFPDDLSEEEILAQSRKFYEQSQQGALGAAGSAAIREPARQVGGAMKAAARIPYWLQPPDVNPETGIPVWQNPETEIPIQKPAEIPPEETALYKAGESLQRGAEKMFPVSPLRQEDFLTQVGAGIGSLPTSVIPVAGPLIYAGSAGEDAVEKAGRFYDNKIAEAMASGNQAEAARLQDEKKYQQAAQFGINASLGFATERFMGLVPGLKHITEGGGKLIPKLVAGQTAENAKKVASYLTKQGVKPAAGELIQESAEQIGSNVGEMAYDPEAEFTAGVMEAGAAGGTVGALASIPLSLLGSKLRKNRLDQLQALRETRTVEGAPPEYGQYITRQRERMGAGVVLGDPGELLPNATATLAGINSGGAPSGRITITPPPPEAEAGIPDITLEEGALGEEEVTTTPAQTETQTTPSSAIQEQGAGESLLRGEETQPEEQLGLPQMAEGGRPAEGAGAEAQAEIQPLTIEETQEYNAGVDLGTDMMSEAELARFEQLAGRVRQLEQAGYEFDEATGWTKPGAVEAPSATTPTAVEPAPAPVEPTPTPDERAAEMERLKKVLSVTPAPVTPAPAAPTAAAPAAPSPAPAPKKERKVSQVRQDAQEFDRLATDIAPDLGLIEDPALLSPVFTGNVQDKGSIAAKMARQKALATVKKRAIQQLGGNPEQNSEADRAALLPQMRDLAAKVQQDRKIQAFDAAIQEGGPVAVNTSNLAVGDKITVGGSDMTITAIDPDTMDATANGGERYGEINLPDNTELTVDAFTPAPTEAPAPAPAPAATERKPRLAPGQNQGDLIASTQAEPLALVGEEVVDLEARKRRQEEAARAAAEAKAAQEKAQTQMDLGDAVSEASDAIAQFVESITPKAGITEGPTPEESARRVLQALTKLASIAIRAGIQSAGQWATSLRLKLGPALQYAWDQANGATGEPTAEVIADVSNLPDQATSSNFGMIYSTPQEPVTTKRGAFEDTVAGRRSLTPEVLDAGMRLAIDTFAEAGVKVRQVGDAMFAPVEGVNQEEAGRKLIDIVKKKFEQAKKAGRADTLAPLIQSLRNHFGVSEAFSPETRDEMYLIGQSEASEFGRLLASLKVSVNDFVALARNVRGFLTTAIYDTFSGESVKGVLDKIMAEYRGQFTEAEIQKIVGERPELGQMLDRLGVLALADTGGRVYRAVQARLQERKPPSKKAADKAAQKSALEDEAIDQIIENALALGVTEPSKPPGRKLTPDERLGLMTRPATQAKIQQATEEAVKEAEFNAGWKAMMVEAAGDEELLQQYRDAMAAGEDPTPEAIEAGLDLPQYAHWRTIRDGFLNYSPTTLKLAQDVIRGRFKGTQFGPKKAAPPAPPRIDLAKLVQQPNAEMSRVIGEQLAAISRIMTLEGATPEAKARVMQMITANVGSQIQLARQRVLNNFLDVKAKTGPTTASDRLQRLINAGITEDPRYRSQKTRDLLKRVAKTYLTGAELSSMATRTRPEKFAFLTGKLNQITAAEKLTDEWMQGAVWTYLTERMMEAENAAVSQIVGANDVVFDPGAPKTEAQVAADRAKAVERLAGGIRAGLLDQRIAESVAKNPVMQRLVPKMGDLVKRVLSTPQAGQAQLAKAFSQALLSELAIDQSLADKTGLALAKAFEAKFERARIRALDLAVQKLSPKQREDAGPGTPLWQKIEQFVNAGGMDSAALLQTIAKRAGWKIPTDEEVARIRDLARLEQQLSTATEEEIKAGITDDIKAAKNLGKRADIMREIQMRWARMTMPIRGNKENIARAINEYTSANLLFKLGFTTKQLIDTATQMFYYTPTRAVATAAERYRTSREPNRANRLWKDTGAALEDAYRARFQALNMGLTAALEAAKGRAEKDTVMGIQSGIRALDRINAKASEYAKNGDYARAVVLRLIGISQLSFRFASALDALQGVLAEQQEIGAWAESQLRLQGVAPEKARKTARQIIGDATAEYALAQALVGDDPNISPKERRAAAWNVVRARQYQRIKEAGLDVGALKELTQDLRSTIGWNVEETGGLGGVIGQGMKKSSDFMAKAGIPNPVGRFSNAIAIGINRGLTFAGGGFVPKAFEGSAWYKTETDKAQRKIEAATGLGLAGALGALVLSGALRVFTRWPDDKEEADLWEREGHRPNTMELDLPNGKILRVSLNTGPIQIVRPALAAIGELQYQVAKRNRLNQKAEAAAKKKGLTFEPRELTAKDIAGALSYGAYSAVAQGRTASGLIGSGVYRQAPDLGKIAAGAVSPLIPFQPLVREMTAMSGPQFNPKDQTFINLLAPTPWSGKVDRNFLGDPVGTPRAQERIMSILTGGTAIVGGQETDRAYQVLAKTGWTPATPQSNKFFQFGRVQRQATPEELTRMQEVRAVELKSRISQLDPATATRKQLDRIEDIANAKAKKAVGAR